MTRTRAVTACAAARRTLMFGSDSNDRGGRERFYFNMAKRVPRLLLFFGIPHISHWYSGCWWRRFCLSIILGIVSMEHPAPALPPSSLDEQRYEQTTLDVIDKAEAEFSLMTSKHKNAACFLPPTSARFENLRRCVRENARVFQDMCHYSDFFDNNPLCLDDEDVFADAVSDLDIDKVRSTLRQFAREWSAEGKLERDSTFQPIIAELVRRFPPNSGIRVCVPGAGLGRLVWELAQLGFDVQGNEVSYFMLLPSNYIMNVLGATPDETVIVYPWVLQTCNHWSWQHQCRGVTVPDCRTTLAADDPRTTFVGNLSMCAGEFVEVYGKDSERGQWDAVVTCFFVDTASNALDYIDVIRHMLADGGVWVNLGPLLFHHAGEVSAGARRPDKGPVVEFSYEELRSYAISVGFHFELEEERSCTYSQNVMSMMSTVYHAAMFVATLQRS